MWDLSDNRVKKIVLVTLGVLIGVLVLINMMRYFNSLPGYTPAVFPTAIPQSQSQHKDIFPTLNPDQVNRELEEILNKRPPLSATEKSSIASFSAELILHPHRGTDFEITYSPILNLFFIRKRGNTDDALILDFFKDPMMRNLYRYNGSYRVFVISRNSAEYSRFVFERQYNEIRSKLPDPN